MSFQPLARKYRPGRFAELLGQEAVAKALANGIALGRPPRSVIFTGVHGVGKTTVARIYAKALNCEQPEDGAEPCNRCASCQAITLGNHEDVIEIDGASNTGVGDVRALQETVSYAPQRSRYKVYIVDEVHMLSVAAFNAFLKTLEEPPAHVVFLFATTEIHKVPSTILSRCQTFYLKKLTTGLILARLRELVDREGLQAEDKALAVLAREGHGSMRDALTLLDQAIALGGGTVTTAALGWMVTSLSSTPYLELLSALCERDVKRALTVVASLDQSGADFTTVTEELARLARHGFVAQGLGIGALDLAMLGLDDAELERLDAIAKTAAPFDLNRIFRTFVQCRTELDGSALDRYVLENYAYEWCLDPGLPDLESLIDGVAKATPVQPVSSATAPATPHAKATAPAQSTAKSGPPPRPNTPQRPPERGTTAPVPPPATRSGSMAPPPTPGPQAGMAPPATSAPKPAVRSFPPSWRQLVDLWRQQKPLQARKLEEVHPLEYSPERIVLAISPDSYASRTLLSKDEQQRIRDQFRELFAFGGTLLIQAKVGGAAPNLPETILSERSRERADRRAQLIEDVTNAPFTRDLLAALDGRVEDVKLTDNDHS